MTGAFLPHWELYQHYPHWRTGGAMADGLKSRIVKVTPELARQWLESNEDNRRLSDEWVRKLARDMVNDEFPNVGETLKFDEKGRLIDGQHRLRAVVLSGK